MYAIFVVWIFHWPELSSFYSGCSAASEMRSNHRDWGALYRRHQNLNHRTLDRLRPWIIVARLWLFIFGIGSSQQDLVSSLTPFGLSSPKISVVEFGSSFVLFLVQPPTRTAVILFKWSPHSSVGLLTSQQQQRGQLLLLASTWHVHLCWLCMFGILWSPASEFVPSGSSSLHRDAICFVLAWLKSLRWRAWNGHHETLHHCRAYNHLHTDQSFHRVCTSVWCHRLWTLDVGLWIETLSS